MRVGYVGEYQGMSWSYDWSLGGYTQFDMDEEDRVTLAIYRGGDLRSRKEGSRVTEKQDVGYA